MEEQKEDKKKVTTKEQFLKACKEDPDLTGFALNKRVQLYALKRCYGNVTKAAAVLGIARKTIYNHVNKDPKYKEAFEDIVAVAHDFVEDQLIENIKGGDTTAIIWWEKSRRRMTDRVDHTTMGEKLPSAPAPIMFIPAEKLTAEQIEQYLNNNENRVSNESIP